jgi:hypothetical protein
VSAAVVALWAGLAEAPASAQSIVCCNQAVNIEGPWIGSGRVKDCQEYLDTAPPETARLMCKQRSHLTCLNLKRCEEFPNETDSSDEPGQAEGAPADDPVVGGLEEGFGVPPQAPPPDGGVSPPRLVYLIMRKPEAGAGREFKAWIDDAACILRRDDTTTLEAPGSAARHEILGKLVPGDGRVKLELRARDLASGAETEPVLGEATGEDRAAIAAATRQALKRLSLVCEG